jgi:hypothetical protein
MRQFLTFLDFLDFIFPNFTFLPFPSHITGMGKSQVLWNDYFLVLALPLALPLPFPTPFAKLQPQPPPLGGF